MEELVGGTVVSFVYRNGLKGFVQFFQSDLSVSIVEP